MIQKATNFFKIFVIKIVNFTAFSIFYDNEKPRFLSPGNSVRLSLDEILSHTVEITLGWDSVKKSRYPNFEI